MFTLENCIVEGVDARRFLARMAYLVWCVGISAYSLGSFMQIVQPFLSIQYDYSTEGIMVIVQVGFQWLFMGRTTWHERIRYLYVALTVSMIGSLMLLPLLPLHTFVGVSALSASVYFLSVVGTIFIIHHRLILRNSLPKVLSVTWVLYRLLLLIFVLFPR